MTAAWLTELELRAGSDLPDYVRVYIGATAGTPAERDAALAEWDAVRFRPRVLRGPRRLELTTSVLGRDVAGPVPVAPFAQQTVVHSEGEAAMARAVRRVGGLLGVSTNTAVPFDRIAATGAPWWFQVYLLSDREITRRLVERAVAAGAEALLLTVDLAVPVSAEFGVDPLEWPEGPHRARLANLDEDERERVLMGGFADVAPGDVAWLREISGVPVVVKGVVRADDALVAVDAGAAGVLVSTHGNRRMGASIGSLGALPEVVAAVGDRAEVFVDSGIRSGAHVLAALAMGARAVFVGRPAMWGLAVDGEQGVVDVLETLTAEAVRALRQSGVRDRSELTPDLLA